MLLGAGPLVAPEALLPATALKLHVAAAATAFLGGTLLLVRAAPRRSSKTPQMLPGRAWLYSTALLGAAAGLQVANGNLDLIILGVFRSDVEVGTYRVAVSGSMLVAFGLQAMDLVIMPEISRLHAAQRLTDLQALVRSSARLILLVAAVASIALVAVGQWALGFVFGDEYRAAYPALCILAFGQLINAGFGPVGMLLNMSGHEGDTLRGVLIAFLANVFLNFSLIPRFGSIGAALATALTVSIWKLALWFQVRRRLGINSVAFGRSLA
jgi:O-antigen/teichoic acid export membrane protein